MSLQIDIEIQLPITEAEKKAMAKVEEALIAAAAMEKVVEENAEVFLLITDVEEIHRLNKEFRGVDRGTDVLSFPQWEPGEKRQAESDMPMPLGDIVISLPHAKEQAKEYGHSLERELAFLAVHGFLHLLGYDHGTEEEESRMFTRQEEILKPLGLTR
ncbi:rRNA maturation RNase YbeY [Marininema halotolerans]|uniref:Endoribonuclease YbeY n=1 Tax=Marininema halotolerans TaxID=1155944 RepID=A0A1I6SYN1_9BACL|nr:rRNA maturation RNase YbeY [Marininema halotolerans]SFS82046.1 probable rRNA maturation factor [Marininema halotolerans]